MPSFPAKRWLRRRSSCGRCALRREEGFLLIEVLISAMLVGVIVVATLTGFSVVSRSTTEQRRHNAAAVLAAESQEQLRSDSATTLVTLEGAGHSYTRTVGGTVFTVTQKAAFGNGSSTTGCAATEEGTKGKGTYILVSSSVSWPRMKGKPVTASSVITPPTGSSLDVEVTNGETPTTGVTVAISYKAVESFGTTTLEATTGSAGCVLFAGIPATSATMQVRETSGIVNKHGTLAWPTEEITLAPNVLTEHQVVLAPGGAIAATFNYESSNEYKHKQNNPSSAEIKETVKGDTFVAFNTEMKVSPEFQTGSNQTAQNFPGGLYEVLPGAVGTYQVEATTQKEPTKYAKGNLFPFPPGKNWTAYAGDCPANDPEELTETLPVANRITDPTVGVPIAGTGTTTLPMTYVLLNVYKKSQSEVKALGAAKEWEALETTSSYPVTITNLKCAGVTPNNETTIKNKHVQATTTGSIWGGHLEAPFQPFGEYELCLFAGGKTYTPKKYTNLVPATKTTLNVYLGEKSQKEKEETRVQQEAETKTARETSEAPAWTKITNEENAEKTTKANEAAAKAAREATEKSEREKWLKEEQKGQIKLKERESKEKTQATNRKTKEAAEKTADENRKSEEAATKTARTNQESARTTAIEAEAKAKTKAIEKENEELAAKEVTVESGKSSC